MAASPEARSAAITCRNSRSSVRSRSSGPLSGRCGQYSHVPVEIRSFGSPSGNSVRSVALIVRGPANPISALGSAKTRSPSEAKLAATPPIVGFVSTEMKSPPASSYCARAAETLAICIRERIPSCIRAPPPEPLTMASGRSLLGGPFDQAGQPSRPPPSPCCPMMNAESVTPNATRRPRIMPAPVRAASFGGRFASAQRQPAPSRASCRRNREGRPVEQVGVPLLEGALRPARNGRGPSR